MQRIISISLYFLLIWLPGVPSLSAQETPADTLTRVYLDCEDCSSLFIRQNFSLVDYVRDRKVADIHLFVTSQPLANGGRQYLLHFIGLSERHPHDFAFPLDTYPNDSEQEVNTKLLNAIKAGLLPFLAAKQPLDIQVQENNRPSGGATQTTNDPWNYWVFEIGGDLDWEKESNRSEYEWEGEIDIERTTEDWRVRSELYGRYEVNRVRRDSTLFSSSLLELGARASVVKSLGPHLSAGLFSRVTSSTFSNIRSGTRLQAALEYNLFPYRESATREFTFAYYIGPQHYRYWEETIYNRMEELLGGHALEINFDLQRPWGRIEARVSGNQFFHDWRKYRLSTRSRISLRLFRGLLIRFGMEANLIHDQLFLPKGNASLEEILLERRALATDYELSFTIGLAYSFGSIYNSIVNTRL